MLSSDKPRHVKLCVISCVMLGCVMMSYVGVCSVESSRGLYAWFSYAKSGLVELSFALYVLPSHASVKWVKS